LKIKGVANKAIESTQNVTRPFSWFAFALVETWFEGRSIKKKYKCIKKKYKCIKKKI